MHYYIDGYNVLFRTLGLRDCSFEQQRQLLIDHLQNAINYLALDVTIVFDAHLRQGERQIFHLLDLKIVFTPTGQNADQYIVEKLHAARHPSQHTVVTSDKGLAAHARSLGTHTTEVGAFIKWLKTRYHNRKRKDKIAKAPPEYKLPTEKKLTKKTVDKATSPPKASQGSFDYYLAAFENNLAAADLAKEEKRKSAKLQKTKKNKKAKNPPTDHHSDMQRWLKVFEEKLEE